MKALIIYATNSGGTRVVSEIIAEQLAAHEFEIERRSADQTDPGLFDGADLVILGSCTWNTVIKDREAEGQLHQHMVQLQSQMTGRTYAGKRFAVFGLGDSSYTNFCAAADKLAAWVQRMRGVRVGQILKLDGFFFDMESNSKLVRAWTRQVLAEYKTAAASRA